MGGLDVDSADRGAGVAAGRAHRALETKPWMVALAAALLFLVFAGARLERVAGGDISLFVVAGDGYADPEQVPSSLTVGEGYGYDGQFFWRLAADPTELDTDRHLGVELDLTRRSQRIGYPLATWLLAVGMEPAIPYALVGVNLLALAAIAWMAAGVARERGWSPWFGLLPATVPAFFFSVSRDLSEPMAAALLLAGVLATRRDRAVVAGLCWAAAIVTREQVIIVVAVFAVDRLVRAVRGRSFDLRQHLPWMIPAGAFVAWQSFLAWRLGDVAFLTSEDNLTAPLTDLVPAMVRWGEDLAQSDVTQPTSLFREQPRALFETLLMAGLVACALLSRRRSFIWERYAVAVLAVLLVCLSDSVWSGPADLRTTAELAVLAWIVVLTDARRRWVAALGAAQTVIALGVAWQLTLTI